MAWVERAADHPTVVGGRYQVEYALRVGVPGLLQGAVTGAIRLADMIDRGVAIEEIAYPPNAIRITFRRTR